MNDKDLTKQEVKALDTKPGATDDTADGCNVDQQAVENEVRELNNDPRNNNLDD